MTRLLPAVALFLLCAAPAAAETRDVTGFTGVSAADRLTVEIVTGQDYAVEVTGRDAGRIRTHLAGQVLRISDKNRPWFGESPDLDAHVRITAPTLRTIAASRGVELEARIDGACAALDVASAMGAEASVVAPRCAALDASASMGGEVNLQGACQTFSASASMGGVIRASEMQCVDVNASASMGGEIVAYASGSYDASAGMGGTINFAGNAASREASTSLGGTISNR